MTLKVPLRSGGGAIGLETELQQCKRQRLELLMLASILADNDDPAKVALAKEKLSVFLEDKSIYGN